MIYLLFGLAVLFLIAIAGFISGAETAITGASKAQLYHLSKKGDGRAKRVLSLHERMTTSIGTILVINQIVLYFIPIVSTLFAVKYLSTTEAAVMQTIIGALIMIYAEIFPKLVALQFTSRYALFVAPLVECIIIFLKPLVTLLESCARLSLKLLGVTICDGKSRQKSDEELRGAIEMHESGGDKDEAEKKIMLKSILDLEEVTVGHIMVHRKNLKTIDASLPMERIAEELTNCPFSRIPVWRDNPENIIGILKNKTFFRAIRTMGDSINSIKITELISVPWFIPETTHLLDQLQNFRKKREHFAMVVDEYGDLKGCITLEDILEEIVGEIVDEYDVVASGLRLQPDGCVIADGATPIRDLNRQFDWSIPEEEAATIAGYVMHELRKIPDVGQTYVISNFKIEILRRQRNQISLLKIIPNSTSAT
ncbi:MAG: CNNM domain-containing protein [Holosporaceae bacterium]|jgi:Mg2+/Co2+ transporter CorB|nr:CNNM domain-containing protein [Holosporaceae bacterium]